MSVMSVASKPIIRRSQLQALLACPVYENGPSEPAAFGSLMHEIYATWARASVRAPGIPTMALMADVVAMFLSAPAGVRADRFDEVRELAFRFADTHEPSLDSLEGVELTLGWDIGPAILVGTLDRLDRNGANSLVITDYKNWWSKGDDRWQLRFYAALVLLARPHIDFVVMRSDYVRLADGVVEFTEDREAILGWWEELVIPGAIKVLSGDVPQEPIGGSACQFCRKRWECALSVAPYRHEPQSVEEAHAMFAETVRLDAAVEERRAALREWYKGHPSEIVNGLEVGYLAPKEPKWQVLHPSAAVDYLTQQGLVKDAITVDSRRVPARIKRHLVSVGLAVEVQPDQVDPTFKYRKGGSDA